MPLSNSQLEKISRHFSKVLVHKNCPACTENDWTVGEIVVCAQFNPNAAPLSDRAIPMVQIICNRCGYTMHFAAKAIKGLLD